VTPLEFGTDITCPTCHGKGAVLGGKLKCGVCYGSGIHRPPQEPRFGGETYDPERDRKRLTGSLLKIRVAMAPGGWWTLARLADIGECSPAAASARVRDLRKSKFGGHTIDREYVADGIWRYRML